MISTILVDDTIKRAMLKMTDKVIETPSEYVLSKASVTVIEHSNVVEIAKNHKILYLFNKLIMTNISFCVNWALFNFLFVSCTQDTAINNDSELSVIVSHLKVRFNTSKSLSICEKV